MVVNCRFYPHFIRNSYFRCQPKNQFSSIDIDPVFVGPAACSGEVVSLTIDGAPVEPITWFGQQIFVVPNGVEYSIEWTANSDVLGFGAGQSGTSCFVAGTDGLINHPAISVFYTEQENMV